VDAIVTLAGPIEFSPGETAVLALIGLVVLAAFAFDVWMIVDAFTQPRDAFRPRGTRIVWIAAMIVGVATSLPGLPIAIMYYVIVRRPARRARRTPGV
jgi:hypothetical protein